MLPSVAGGACSRTHDMAEALKQDGFEVDIADNDEILPDRLAKSRKSQDSYMAVILGLGVSPAKSDIEKLRLIWRYIPDAFVVACAADFSEKWESRAAEFVRDGRLFMLDNPVDILALRRLLASLYGVWKRHGKIRRKLGRLEQKAADYSREISRRKEDKAEADRYTTAVENANQALEEFCAATEAATQTKNEFLANMSHEIRTPMTAILGFAEELLEPELTEKDRIAAATTIQRNGKHLLSIINDILDFSKIEAGKMAIEHIECSPRQLVDDVYSLMKEKARCKHLSFRASRMGEVPDLIKSDPTRIRQILINLVGNAIKFTSHGSIEISYGLEKTGSEDHKIFFAVKDTGIGMTEEQIGRLFEPFSQADSSTTRKYGGSGLGLSICKHLLNRLGGEISVQSQFGQGSTFRAVMPFGIPTEKDGESGGCLSVSEETKGRPEQNNIQESILATCNGDIIKRRVLVAEDAPDNQRLIRKILEKAGFDVFMAGNGLAAVEIAAKESRNGKPFGLVLMDIQMPILDGYQATVRLREEGYSGPIIALTAHAMGSEVEKILKAGCNAYLAKPFTRQGLLSAIAESVPNCESTSTWG